MILGFFIVWMAMTELPSPSFASGVKTTDVVYLPRYVPTYYIVAHLLRRGEREQV